MKKLVSPSILSADYLNLQKEIEMLNESEADYIHVDVMDGVYVPNITIGLPVVESIKKVAKKPLDVHLMIINPEKYVERFVKAGADILTIHAEACTHLHRVIYEIKQLGVKAGVALNPHTPVSTIKNIVNDVDLVLIMSVNPGFGGQKIIPNTFKKVMETRKLFKKYDTDAIIEIDGGVTAENAGEAYKAGVDMLVAGYAVFGSDNPKETITKIKHS